MQSNESGMRRQTTEMQSEHGAKEESLLQRFLMALMRAFAGAAA